MEVSINGGTPVAGWFIVEKLSINLSWDDLGFQETSISHIYIWRGDLCLDFLRPSYLEFRPGYFKNNIYMDNKYS